MADREIVCICGKTFITNENAQKYCSAKCRRTANRYKRIPTMIEQTCNFCEKTFSYPRKKKYCSNLCRDKANGRGVDKPRKRGKPSMTLEQVAVASREAGLSYGQYVARFGL